MTLRNGDLFRYLWNRKIKIEKNTFVKTTVYDFVTTNIVYNNGNYVGRENNDDSGNEVRPYSSINVRLLIESSPF